MYGNVLLALMMCSYLGLAVGNCADACVQQRAIELLEATDDAAYSSDDVRYVTMHTP